MSILEAVPEVGTPVGREQYPAYVSSLEEWYALPEETEDKYELVEGWLVMAPKPTDWHQIASRRFSIVIEPYLPPGYAVIQEVEVLIQESPPTLRVPDVLVVARDSIGTRPKNGSEVLLAIEVISPSNSRNDLVSKLNEYARIGIPNYWIFDPRTQVLRVFQLPTGERHYVQLGEFAPQDGDVAVPFGDQFIPVRLERITSI